VRVAVTPVASTAETVKQSVYFVDKADKRALLEHLLGAGRSSRALVFTRTKHGANRSRNTSRRPASAPRPSTATSPRAPASGPSPASRAGTIRVLVATDIAARGIDVDGISHVINYDLPNVPESYVHRIGRTGRAGATGIAWAFCDRDEKGFLVDIERTIRQRIEVVTDHPFPPTGRDDQAGDPSDRERRPGGPPRRGGGGGGGGGNRRGGAGPWRGRRTGR
jgi:ATP-dependent RNA helicase RhlE